MRPLAPHDPGDPYRTSAARHDPQRALDRCGAPAAWPPGQDATHCGITGAVASGPCQHAQARRDTA